MTFEQKVAQAFRMDNRARKRHSNPCSVYSRFTMVPLLALALWSRVWLGWWSLILIAAVLLWLWMNPRLFPPPKSTNNWASKVVLGEWVWMNRKAVPVPQHHRRLPNVLSIVGVVGAVIFVWGLFQLRPWITAEGGTLMIVSKLWFADRMVWIYEDMKEATPEYRSWLY